MSSWFYKAVLWFVKKSLLIGLIPSLLFLLLPQVEFAIVSYGTLGVLVSILTLHFYYQPQFLVYDNLGLSRTKLYAFAFAAHALVSIIGALIYRLIF